MDRVDNIDMMSTDLSFSLPGTISVMHWDAELIAGDIPPTFGTGQDDATAPWPGLR